MQTFFLLKLQKSPLGLQRFPGKVVKRKRQQREHDDANPVMMQRIAIAEPRNGAVSRRFVEFDANPKKPNDSARRNQPRSIQTPRTDLRLRSDLLQASVLG